jgi:hypothetical protein
MIGFTKWKPVRLVLRGMLLAQWLIQGGLSMEFQAAETGDRPPLQLPDEHMVLRDLYEPVGQDLFFHTEPPPQDWLANDSSSSSSSSRSTDVLRMRTSTDKEYVCAESLHDFAGPDQDRLALLANETLKEAETQRALQLLRELERGGCLTYSGSFWSYEYCHNQFVKQHHGGLEYFLGFRNGSVNEPTLVLKNSLGVHYLRHTWGHGDRCHKGHGPFRVTEVQYHCCKTEHIAFVDEASECRYQVLVHSPRLCSLDFLNNEPPKIQTLRYMDCYLKAPRGAKEDSEPNSVYSLRSRITQECVDRNECTYMDNFKEESESGEASPVKEDQAGSAKRQDTDPKSSPLTNKLLHMIDKYTKDLKVKMKQLGTVEVGDDGNLVFIASDQATQDSQDTAQDRSADDQQLGESTESLLRSLLAKLQEDSPEEKNEDRGTQVAQEEGEKAIQPTPDPMQDDREWVETSSYTQAVLADSEDGGEEPQETAEEDQNEPVFQLENE